jgi:MATE family multidrug resistance protein
MTVAKLAIPLIVSRLGEMVSSLIYFSFVGHFITSSLDQASFAWAFVSFLTVIGIGFFSVLMIEIAGASDLASVKVLAVLNTSIKLACFLGGGIVAGFALYLFQFNREESFSGVAHDNAKVLFLLSLSIPAIYLQIVIFNYFNALRQTKYELIFVWIFNASILLMSAAFLVLRPDVDVVDFIAMYVGIKWMLVLCAFIFFDRRLRVNVNGFTYGQTTIANQYTSFFAKGIPLALCFGGESLLYFILSIVAKNLGSAELSAYQASLHFLSVIYMISIGVGNATGIVVARAYEQKNISAVRKIYLEGGLFGLIILFPSLLSCFYLTGPIASLYTSDEAVRGLMENNIVLAIPFLLFEYVYIVTRMTLRSMGDFWVPTFFTITSLNILGLGFSFGLLFYYDYSVRSIFLSLVLCSFVLMAFLLWRLWWVLRRDNYQIEFRSKYT